MEVINEALRLYRISPDEMTIGQIRKHFSNFSDDCLVGHFSVYYDSEKDIVYFGTESDTQMEKFCIRMLSDMEYAKEALPGYERAFTSVSCKEMAAVLWHCVNKRLEKVSAEKVTMNPESRFITVLDDVFQISKIVSIRRRDEGYKCYIEVFITNKRASIKKEFTSRALRDSEYNRIISVLQAM